MIDTDVLVKYFKDLDELHKIGVNANLFVTSGDINLHPEYLPEMKKRKHTTQTQSGAYFHFFNPVITFWIGERYKLLANVEAKTVSYWEMCNRMKIFHNTWQFLPSSPEFISIAHENYGYCVILKVGTSTTRLMGREFTAEEDHAGEASFSYSGMVIEVSKV